MKPSAFRYALLTYAASVMVNAQEAASPAPMMENAPDLTMMDIITKGGGIMYVLVGLSFIAVMLILFYLFTLRKNILCPLAFINQAKDLADHGDVEGLAELAAANSSPAARIINAGLLASSPNAEKIDLSPIQNAMEEEGSRQVAQLWTKIQYLMDIGTIAPMIGLLGTVWGMMVSFTGLDAGISLANKSARLTSGVSQAMFTTFGGLIVGILSIAAYSIFRGHLNRLTSHLEGQCATLMRRLASAKK
ncbi:MAG: MotA/TolQ/ExbB proton channel family protein [Victivallales bacterium]|nr:MotA/TolQ/ExbB proton channel family protein [Victivallales bacterium]MBQ6471888.1 MotA/TolQ/ExbB proton channel family protein [Victivallales bacterium]